MFLDRDSELTKLQVLLLDREMKFTGHGMPDSPQLVDKLDCLIRPGYGWTH